MYGITIRYKDTGYYKFLDTSENTFYIGSAKSMYTRLNQHFSKKGSNVRKEAYSKTASFWINKNWWLYHYSCSWAILNKYKPKYNKKDNDDNINSKAVANEEYYAKLKNWQLYYKLKKLDKVKIDLTKKQDKLVMAVTYVVFFLIIVIFIL